jgi:hypothetical protein
MACIRNSSSFCANLYDKVWLWATLSLLCRYLTCHIVTARSAFPARCSGKHAVYVRYNSHSQLSSYRMRFGDPLLVLAHLLAFSRVISTVSISCCAFGIWVPSAIIRFVICALKSSGKWPWKAAQESFGEFRSYAAGLVVIRFGRCKIQRVPFQKALCHVQSANTGRRRYFG